MVKSQGRKGRHFGVDMPMIQCGSRSWQMITREKNITTIRIEQPPTLENSLLNQESMTEESLKRFFSSHLNSLVYGQTFPLPITIIHSFMEVGGGDHVQF